MFVFYHHTIFYVAYKLLTASREANEISYCDNLCYKHDTQVIRLLYGSTALGGLALLVVEVSRSQSGTPHFVGLFWTSGRPVTGTYI